MREPWRSVLRATGRAYVGIGTLIAILGYGQATLVRDSGAIDRCLQRAGFAAEYNRPAMFAYLAAKGLFWPVSLGWTMAGDRASLGDWAFGRYDPFDGWC
jgi:hypothetical protein